MSCYRLADHIYFTKFQTDTILLDLKKDKYLSCSKEIAEILRKVHISNEIDHISQETLTALIKMEILEVSSIQPKQERKFQKHCNGPSPLDISWNAQPKQVKNSAPFSKPYIFFCLLKIRYFMFFRGFYRTMLMIKRTKKKEEDYYEPSLNELNNLGDLVNTAAYWFPKRTKCLEWSMTFVIAALKKGWRCNLEIGVQNYPFSAHAWVKAGHRVVQDSQDMSLQLATILREPFES